MQIVLQQQGFVVDAPIQIGHEFRLADQVGDRLAPIDIRVEIEMGGCLGIQSVNLAVLVEDHHAIRQGLARQAEALQSPGQGILLFQADAYPAMQAGKDHLPDAEAPGHPGIQGAPQPTHELGQVPQVIGQIEQHAAAEGLPGLLPADEEPDRAGYGTKQEQEKEGAQPDGFDHVEPIG